MADLLATPDRRTSRRSDRRRKSRSGRRASDPRTDWRRASSLFAGYILFLAVHWLPAGIKHLAARARRRAAN